MKHSLVVLSIAALLITVPAAQQLPNPPQP